MNGQVCKHLLCVFKSCGFWDVKSMAMTLPQPTPPTLSSVTLLFHGGREGISPRALRCQEPQLNSYSNKTKSYFHVRGQQGLIRVDGCHPHSMVPLTWCATLHEEQGHEKTRGNPTRAQGGKTQRSSPIMGEMHRLPAYLFCSKNDSQNHKIRNKEKTLQPSKPTFPKLHPQDQGVKCDVNRQGGRDSVIWLGMGSIGSDEAEQFSFLLNSASVMF